MEYDDEFLKKITQVGTLGYPLTKIINILDVTDEIKFTKDFYNPKSKIAVAYQKGIDKADFILDSKLFEMAKNGDLKALQHYEKRKNEQLFESRRQRRDKNFRN